MLFQRSNNINNIAIAIFTRCFILFIFWILYIIYSILLQRCSNINNIITTVALNSYSRRKAVTMQYKET